jgi:Fe-S cluster assembly iron-binding protein IscA
MLSVSDKAVSLLKAVKQSEGAPAGAGVRIQRAGDAEDHGKTVTLSVAIRNSPVPSDESFEQNGLRIFVEDALVEPLDGRMLDVREDDDNEGPALVLR